MQEFDVGARLIDLRNQSGMSQRQLAEAAGVPNGQVSMIETNKSSPSVSSLRKILSGLGIGMAEFFGPEAPQEDQPFFKASDLRDLTSLLYSERLGTEGKITLKQVGNAKLHNLQILHETYQPGADTGAEMLEHHANEGGIVVSGEIEVTVGEKVSVLKAGDAFLFNSREPHRFRNISKLPVTIVSGCTPPYL